MGSIPITPVCTLSLMVGRVTATHLVLVRFQQGTLNPHKLTDRLTGYEPVNVGSIPTEDIRSDSLMDKTTGFYPVFEGSSPSQSIKILKNTIYCVIFLKSLYFIQYLVSI